MRGRIFGVKKTTIMSISFYLAFLLIITSTLLSVFLLKNNFVWFFFLCLFCGLHLLVKAVLFHADSSCYFGSILFFIGGFGLIVHFCGLFYFASVFYISAFALSSFFTFLFFKQVFHLWIAIAIIVSDIAWFFYKINLLPLWIFVAILCKVCYNFFENK